MKTLEPNSFYWVRRLDDRSFSVVETWRDGKALNLMGNLNCPDIEEAEEFFEILCKIEPPAEIKKAAPPPKE